MEAKDKIQEVNVLSPSEQHITIQSFVEQKVKNFNNNLDEETRSKISEAKDEGFDKMPSEHSVDNEDQTSHLTNILSK